MAEPTSTDTYRKIATRLAAFSPPIKIEQFIGSDLVAGRNTLQGISFVTSNQSMLLQALRSARDNDGNKAFVEGSKADPQHWNNQGDPNDWPLRKSFSETHGIGFREIWRPHLSNRPLSLDDARPNRFRPKWDTRYSANFNDSREDHSSLHCAVAPDICNIHIDEMGFVITGPGGDTLVDADAGQHIVNELWIKTKLEGKVPKWLVDRLSVELPNSTNNYSRIGGSFDIQQKRDYRIRWTMSCSVLAPLDCSTTVSISGTHNIWGSK